MTTDDRVELLLLVKRAYLEEGYSQSSLAAAMGKNEGYVSKVLNAEKPLGASFLEALPVDVDTKFAELHAKARGLFVVSPVGGEEAMQQFIAGFVGMFARPAVSVRPRMAQAVLPPARKKGVA